MNKKVTNISKKRNERDAHKYRLLQAQELIDRFTVAVGHPPSSPEEVEAWLQAQSRKPAV